MDLNAKKYSDKDLALIVLAALIGFAMMGGAGYYSITRWSSALDAATENSCYLWVVNSEFSGYGAPMSNESGICSIIERQCGEAKEKWGFNTSWQTPASALARYGCVIYAGGVGNETSITAAA